MRACVQEAFSEFQVLEERITSVSTKVVHLGDQLEASNNRRMRAVEAQDLMYHLKEFEKPKPALEIFTDPGRVRKGPPLGSKFGGFKVQSLFVLETGSC